MKTNRSAVKHILTLVMSVMVLFQFSCNKTTEKIGDGLLPENDYIGVYFTDTIDIVCHSESIDSMATTQMTYLLLGSMVDPIMGRTDANIFSQLHISATNQNFGEDPILDSIVLQLSLNGFYGDTSSIQTIHVYELSDSLSMNTTYYHFDDIAAEGLDLANGFQFRPSPSVAGQIVGNDTLSQPVIRIPLDRSLGEKLLFADSTAYLNPVNFKDYFYGLKISCESVEQGGGICYISPTNNVNTVLQLYYHESTEDEKLLRYDYHITSADMYFNQYQHDYSMGTPAFVQQVVDGDTILGQETLYLQSMSGVRTLITFPNFINWTDELEEGCHIIINEAKLILPASPIIEDSSVYTPPTTLALLSRLEDGKTALLPDYYEGVSYYGGGYDNHTKTVNFRISEYLQNVLLGEVANMGIYLSINGAAYNAQRWAIAGPDSNAEDKMRCEIKYSIINE